MAKYKYQITYFDPSDEEGRREKTWKFKTLKDAKAQQEDLKVVWDLADDELPKIEKINPPKK